jgi:hypothetical protein
MIEVTAEQRLAAIHATLFPEQWKDCDPDVLNSEGILEWSADQLDEIAIILRQAELSGMFTPDAGTEATNA